MKTSKYTVITVVFVAFIGLIAAHPAAAEGRYFVKTNRGFWKNSLGVRHSFNNGFSADLNDFQVGFAQMFGVELEQLPIFQISPEKNDTAAKSVVSAKQGSRQFMGSDWGLQTIAPTGTDLNKGGGATVAILDTGIDVTHPDLNRRLTDCKDFSNPRFAMVEGKCEDKNGHGTHVAGILAADKGTNGNGMLGIAPAAKLLVYKVCGNNGICAADDIAAGIRNAADAKANIISMSFGSNSDTALIRDAIKYAADKKVILVAAAGNDGPFTASIDYPAAYPEVVGVGAITQRFTTPDWSSRGINDITDPDTIEEKDIELSAPGESIESTWLNGTYNTLSGTSMATPYISGLAARLYDQTNDATVIRELLHEATGSTTATSTTYGYGVPVIK